MKEKIEGGKTRVVEEGGKKEEKKIGKTINEYLKERGIEAPPISVHIFYSGHFLAGDLKGIESVLEAADIIVPEYSGWDEKVLKQFQDISHGVITVEEALGGNLELAANGFAGTLFERLHGKNKKIMFVDNPSASMLQGNIEKAMDLMSDFKKKVFTSEQTFDQTIDQLKFVDRQYYTSVMQDREEQMLSNFGPATENMLVDNPELLKKDNIQIVMILGANHLGFSHKLKKQHPDSTRQFVNSPISFSFQHEVFKRLETGKSIDDELYARQLFEMIIRRKKFKELFAGEEISLETFKTSRQIVDKFSVDEIREIFGHIRDKNFNTYLDDVLAKKSIVIGKNNIKNRT